MKKGVVGIWALMLLGVSCLKQNGVIGFVPSVQCDYYILDGDTTVYERDINWSDISNSYVDPIDSNLVHYNFGDSSITGDFIKFGVTEQAANHNVDYLNARNLVEFIGFVSKGETFNLVPGSDSVTYLEYAVTHQQTGDLFENRTRILFSGQVVSNASKVEDIDSLDFYCHLMVHNDGDELAYIK